MKFVNVPRDVVKFLHYKYKSFVLVQIGGPEEDLPLVERSNCLEVIRVRFDDVNEERFGLVHFSSEHAKKILDFYHKYKDKIDVFVVHCTAGISRSAGVAAALHRIHYNEDDFMFWSRFTPNMLVYRTLLETENGNLYGPTT